MKRERKRKIIKIIKRGAGIILGSIIQALGIILFLAPNKIAPGGFSGLAIVIHYVIPIPIGVIYFALNAPLFILAARKYGFGFIGTTLFATIASSVAIDVLNPYFSPLTNNPILASIYGGVLVGVGVGIVFKNWASTGGTDLLGQLLYDYFGLSFGTTMLIFDTLIVILAAFVFKSPDYALYGFLGLFVSAKSTDLVQEGLSYSKSVFIISNSYERIKIRIIRELHRGVTEFKVKGSYTGIEKTALLSVVPQRQLSSIKEIIHDEDPDAFVVILNAAQVIGEGFLPIEEAKR